MTNYFGTDGIRGKVGELITAQLAFKLGYAIGAENVVVVGRDTRTSGGGLCAALDKGVTAHGGKCINLGVIPTNAVSHFTRFLGAAYGVMISASHNPPEYNGFKVFDSEGAKLQESQEQSISATLDGITVTDSLAESADNESIVEDGDFIIKEHYINDLLNAANVNCDGLDVALDCCYGSAYGVAPSLFSRAGARVKSYCNFNKGELINVNCGATCPQFLGGLISDFTPLAFAFDGDADRLAVYEKGELLDNNAVFYCFARYLKEEGLLTNDLAIGTVLTNVGLERSLGEIGIQLRRSDVGDVKMFRLMNSLNAALAGEESGHYLFANFACSSDALFNALMVCKIYLAKGSLKRYSSAMRLLPVTVKNIPLTARQKTDLVQNCVFEALNEVYKRLYPACRVILRPSGTENVARVFVEGDPADARLIIADAVASINKFYTAD